MYALTEVGIDVQRFASWMRATFSLREPAAPSRRSGPDEVWVTPSGAPRLPDTVVKNRVNTEAAASMGGRTVEDRADRRSREHTRFRRENLETSISNAVGLERHGQNVSPHDLTRGVVEWVLWCCDGQPVVRTSQLAAFAAGALRRCAPIAYLRWVVLGKELFKRELYDEVRALIERPPPRLVFQRQPQPGLNQPFPRVPSRR